MTEISNSNEWTCINPPDPNSFPLEGEHVEMEYVNGLFHGYVGSWAQGALCWLGWENYMGCGPMGEPLRWRTFNSEE